MSRYIDADKFKNHIENCICEVQNTNGNSEDFKIVLRALANQPIANVKEVVYGEWKIEKKSKFNYDKCSVCGFNKPSFLEFRKYNFCPNCGVDMRGDK